LKLLPLVGDGVDVSHPAAVGTSVSIVKGGVASSEVGIAVVSDWVLGALDNDKVGAPVPAPPAVGTPSLGVVAGAAAVGVETGSAVSNSVGAPVRDAVGDSVVSVACDELVAPICGESIGTDGCIWVGAAVDVTGTSVGPVLISGSSVLSHNSDTTLTYLKHDLKCLLGLSL
jgi:hypothetical protein